MSKRKEARSKKLHREIGSNSALKGIHFLTFMRKMFLIFRLKMIDKSKFGGPKRGGIRNV